MDFETWYQTNGYSTKITPVKVKIGSETARIITIFDTYCNRLRRQFKVSTTDCYFRTFEEARGSLLMRLQNQINRAEESIKTATNAINELWARPVPEEPPCNG